MTTTVSVSVNGRYRATVVQSDAMGEVVGTTMVEGNYEGSPNPSGTASFSLTHPAAATFEINEESVPPE